MVIMILFTLYSPTSWSDGEDEGLLTASQKFLNII